MVRFIVFGILVVLGSTLQAQTIHVRGKISDQAGNPVDKAVIDLMQLGIKDTTGPDGLYTLSKGGTAVRPSLPLEGISLEQGILQITLSNPAPVTVEVFDLLGNQLRMESLPDAAVGTYRWNLAENPVSDQMVFLKATMGRQVRTFRYRPNAGSGNTVNQPVAGFTTAKAYLAKTSAALDTLRITTSGYATKKVATGSLDTTMNISLAPTSAEERSAGCGKSPTLKSGNGQSFTPAGGGSARTFNLRIPADYDNATAYRLIVGLHWLNGTANNVSEGNSGATVKPYYGIWELANPAGAKATTIFVAPQGIGNGWGNSGGQDVKFIRGLVEKLESEFCIDKSRVFAEGFSMGGSMSYALACGASDMFRGIAAHSGGPMSGCDKTNRKPVAYFMTHGTKDGVCTYPGYGVPQVNDFAQLNGCQAMDIPGTLKPTDNSGMNPACADFKGCGDGHPARACIFVGDHTPTPGGSNSWVPGETWKFISKF